MDKPELREIVKTTQYWDCGIQGKGHRHATEAGAAKCMLLQNKPTKDHRARRQQMLQMRRQGATYREIGERFGITGSRASNICAREEYREQVDKEHTLRMDYAGQVAIRTGSIRDMPADILQNMVSERTSDLLRKLMRDTFNMKLGHIIDMSDEQLLKTQNMGRKSLRELRDILKIIQEGKI